MFASGRILSGAEWVFIERERSMRVCITQLREREDTGSHTQPNPHDAEESQTSRKKQKNTYVRRTDKQTDRQQLGTKSQAEEEASERAKEPETDSELESSGPKTKRNERNERKA